MVKVASVLPQVHQFWFHSVPEVRLGLCSCYPCLRKSLGPVWSGGLWNTVRKAVVSPERHLKLEDILLGSGFTNRPGSTLLNLRQTQVTAVSPHQSEPVLHLPLFETDGPLV